MQHATNIYYVNYSDMKLIYPNNGRKLKQMITGLLKSWLVQEVQRVNYVKAYTLIDAKIKAEEIKLVELIFKQENEEKITKMIAKNWPEAKIT